MFLRLLALALLLGLAPAAPAAEGQHFLWRVRAAEGGPTLYLAGSVHVLRASDLPLATAYEDAWRATTALVLEVDLASLAVADIQRTALEMGSLRGRQRLKHLLSARGYRAFRDHTAALDLPRPALEKLEPWFAALTALSVVMDAKGYDDARGVDRLFADRAAAERRPVTGLESLTDQLAVFDTLPGALQERFLLDTLDDLDRLDEALGGLIASWKAGDVAGMAALQREGLASVPAFYAAVITQRHAAWVPQLEARLGSGPDTLVVVGAQHLVGPDALPTLLEAQGYVVERL